MTDDEELDKFEQRIVLGPVLKAVQRLLRRHLNEMAATFDGNLQRPDARAAYLFQLNHKLQQKQQLDGSIFMGGEATFERGASIHDRQPPLSFKVKVDTIYGGVWRSVVLHYSMRPQ